MTTHRLRRSGMLLATALAAVTLIAAGCSSGGSSGGNGKQTDSGGAINVWVNSPRVPGVKAFEKSHPNIKVNMTVIGQGVGSSQVREKFTLFQKSHSGWPDAIFWPDNSDVVWAASDQYNYTADLGKLLPKSFTSKFDGPTIAQCKINGTLVCIRNDIAPDVLWYNTKLFAQWGYQPPQTWEQYTSLALKIAKDHPGYYSGFIGDGYATGRYLWSSGCPFAHQLDKMKVQINLQDPRCVRVEQMLSKLLAAKAVATSGYTDTATANLGTHLVMTPGAVWYGLYIFKDTLKIPAGQMAASMPLYWKGDAKKITGDEGGGLYSVSSHIKGKELKNALTFVQWMCDGKPWQVKLSTGLPGWDPLREAWLNEQGKTGYFADYAQTKKAILAAPSRIAADRQLLLYKPIGIWASTVKPAIAAGKPFSDAWKAFGQELDNQAKSVGYQVVEK